MSRRKLDVVVALAQMYRREMTKPSIQLYIAAISGLSDAETEQAAAVAAQKLKFMAPGPQPPTELIELVRSRGVSYEAQALLAFEELERALDADRPKDLSQAIAAVVRTLGGFQKLRETPDSEFYTWKRKEFLTAYVTLLKENPDRLAALAGPGSGLAVSFNMMPTQEELQQIEDQNRRLLTSLPAGPTRPTDQPTRPDRRPRLAGCAAAGGRTAPG